MHAHEFYDRFYTVLLVDIEWKTVVDIGNRISGTIA